MTPIIRFFEVPAGEDEAFLAGWEGGAGLYRALRGDVALRYVQLSHAGTDGRYDVMAEDGEPAGVGGVLLVDPVEVPNGGDGRFIASWERLHALLAARQGYLGSRLHRAAEPAAYRFVAVVRWSSPLMYARALQQPEIAAVPFPGCPALYLPV